LLAAATILFVVGTDLPKKDKLDKMDLAVIATLLTNVLIAIESAIVYHVCKAETDGGDGDCDDTREVDLWFAVILPAIYVLFSVMLFLPPVLKRRAADRHVPRKGQDNVIYMPVARLTGESDEDEDWKRQAVKLDTIVREKESKKGRRLSAFYSPASPRSGAEHKAGAETEPLQKGREGTPPVSATKLKTTLPPLEEMGAPAKANALPPILRTAKTNAVAPGTAAA
jgi:hypothetical protein